MPYEIQLNERPAGYAVEDATGIEGHPTKIVAREFVSSEDGDLFISRLEGFPNILISKLPPEANVLPSTLDHLLAVIYKDLRAIVYVNELAIIARIRAARAIRAGELVREDDIVDIDKLTFQGIEIPKDAGVLCILSSGWRKGLFFDFVSLAPEGMERDYDLGKLLGSYLAYLSNQAIFALTESGWNFLIDQQWFPFISLPKRILRTMTGRATAGSDLDLLLPEIANHVQEMLPIMLERWSQGESFKPHIDLLRHAANEFLEGDYVSTTAILYPRIEGLLRTVHESLHVQEKATQKVLTERLIDARKDEFHRYSWLLPDMFRRYLEEAYFANFEPGKPAKLSRHSVGHGVANVADFNRKAACIGLLVLDQIFHFLPKAATA